MNPFLLLLIVAAAFPGLYYLIYVSLRRLRPQTDKAQTRNTAFTVFFLILLVMQLFFLTLYEGTTEVRHPGQSPAQQEFFAITAPKLLTVNYFVTLIEIIFAVFETAMILFQNRLQHFKRAATLLGLIILSGMSLPAFGSVSEERKRYMCEYNVKQIYQNLAGYQQTYGQLPDALARLNLPASIFSCNNASDPAKLYQYHGAGKNLKDSPRFLLLDENAANHPGLFQIRLYSDGTIETAK